MIERSHLTIVREISRQGSLTAAADSLCLTQSALSHAIKKLEQQLKTPIWIKEGRKLRFTQAGEALLSLANRLLPQFEYTEEVMRQIASGHRGKLRIGVECYPCYQWLLKVVTPFLQQWQDVDVDVKQKFQFGGIGALFGYDIDILVTPDPLFKEGLLFEPVFDYEQVLVVAQHHPLAVKNYVAPSDIINETLITYPVEIQRLDIYSQFLMPANCSPKIHKIIETTDIMLQMVAAGRGIAALPRWLVDEYMGKIPITSVRLGSTGITKQIFLGIRAVECDIRYLSSFIGLARTVVTSPE